VCDYLFLERESQAEIGLDKVGAATPIMINDVITSLAEEPDMGSETIFESTADVPERTALDARRCVVEPRIELRKARVYRLPIPACEKNTEPAKHVWRQVNTGPEVIQREPQYNV
jgi:hypothetical protein